MSDGPEIREHMEVVGSDGGHVGTVDRLEGGRIKLTRGDDPDRTGTHRSIPLGVVASAEAGQVRLVLTAQQARAMAAGGLEPGDVVEDATVPVRGDGDGAADAGAGSGAGVPDDGGGPGGPGARSNVGSVGGPHGDGTGGGGTSSGGYLGGGGGIVDDPNMDPDAGRDSPP